MKTDRELLELAAKAAGLPVDFSWGDIGGYWPCGVREDGNVDVYWNPIDDDGDALRLAVKLGIIVSFSVDLTAAYAKRWDIVPVNEPTTDEIGQIHNPDLLTATRRAIVLAAAAIGSRLP